jgi:hypothetical protein
VIENPVITTAEAEGLRVRNEMDFVAGRGEFDAEFGSDDSGAAVCRITGDADAHCAALQSAGFDGSGGACLDWTFYERVKMQKVHEDARLLRQAKDTIR